MMVNTYSPSPTTTVFAGIDPGGYTLGLCFMTVDVRDASIKRIDSMTLEGEKLPDGMGGLECSQSDRYNRLYRIQTTLTQYYHYYHPSMVICESPFFNRFRPMAYGSLSELLSMIRTSVVMYSPHIPFKTYSPSEIKKGVNAGHISDKKAMYRAMSGINELIDVMCRPIEQCSEHEIDAIAACYTHLNAVRNYLKGELPWYNLKIL